MKGENEKMKKRIMSLALMMMFTLCGALFCVPTVGAVVNAQAASVMYQERSGTPIGRASERIYYSDSVIDTFIPTPNRMPVYGAVNCGATAGINTIAWYNRELSNLIPGHAAGRYIGSSWVWTGQNQTILDLFAVIDTFMGGGGSNGVTINGYLTGIISYANARGYGIAISDTRAGNNSLKSSFKTSIRAGGLVALFLDTFNVTASMGVEHFNGYDLISLTQFSGCHVMVAYGYKEVTYLDEYGNVFRQDMYARVQTGYENGWIRINDFCTLDAAWLTHIY